MTFIHLQEKCGGRRHLVFHHLTMFKREKKWVVQVGYILKWKYPLAPIQGESEHTFKVGLHTKKVLYCLCVSEPKIFFLK